MKRLNHFLSTDFIFSPRYHIWRHIIYWSLHINIWAAFWLMMGAPVTFGRQVFNMAMWVPAFILFSYPLAYGAIPHVLLKGRVSLFLLIILGWGVLGIFFDIAYRSYVLIPIQEAMGWDNIIPRGPLAFCYLCMTTSAASPMAIKFFKLCTLKHQEGLQAQQEKITAELQLLKAQLHPHFLFNTLNNIYSFSLDKSPKTPSLILKLSSLLGYMLYDCNTSGVRLEKEIAIMRNYIDLERERYGNKIEIVWNVTGDIADQWIAPLLLLPFLENAFKHGISEQLAKHRLSVDVSVNEGVLRCKVVNSKNEGIRHRDNGIGIANVKKRLAFIYPGNHDLKIADEGNFFIVWLEVRLSGSQVFNDVNAVNTFINEKTMHETREPAY